jgi:hypothetical protein
LPFLLASGACKDHPASGDARIGRQRPAWLVRRRLLWI